VHFYSNFGRKSRSNRGTPSKFCRERAPARARRAGACRAPAPATTVYEPPVRLPRSPHTFPTQLAPSPRRGRRTPRCRTSSPARRRTELPGRPRPARAAPLPFSCSRVAYKGSYFSPRRADPAPAPRPSRPWRRCRQPRRALGSAGFSPKPSVSPPSLASTKARRPFTSPSRATLAGRGHSRWPPAHSPRRPFPGPTNPKNRSPRPKGPSPARARPALAGGWPEFGRTAAGRPPRGHIAKGRFFRGASTQKYNSNSKVTFLLLVNCVENHRKITKNAKPIFLDSL
jgi:hypothetical protein